MTHGHRSQTRIRGSLAAAIAVALVVSAGCGSILPSNWPGMSAIFPGQQDASIKKRAEADSFPSAQQSGI
jgi:hypothetical protein